MSWNPFKRDLYKEMTQASDRWWSSIYKPDDFYDCIHLDMDLHLCGSESVMEAKASELMGHKVDFKGTAGLALPVKINGRWHKFVLATEIGFSQREINYFTSGHEEGHIIDFANEQQNPQLVDYPNPDDGRD